VPASTSASSFTFLSAQTGFVLGTAPCAHRPCTVILRTEDRGRSWRGLPAPLQPVSAQGGRGLWGLRFADARRGFAYGDGMWATTDGGGSWRRASVPGPFVVAFAAVRDRELVAVTATCAPGAGGCANTLTLYHRPLGGGRWRRVVSVGPDTFSATVEVHGKVVWVLVGRRLFVSTNDGVTFGPHRQPCPPGRSQLPLPFAVADDGPHTYLLCIGEGFTGHTLKFVYRTTGTGSGWPAVGKPPAAGDDGEFTAGSDHALVIATASAASWLYGSGDSGRRWRTVLFYGDGGEGWRDLGFTTATDGAVIHAPADQDGESAQGMPGQLLLTDDGGRTWRATAF
jgi:hypothetical protein